MTWTADLEKIRYFLRDPNGAIWSEAALRHMYNDVQQDFAHKTQYLEDVAVQRVPGLYQGSYLYDWESKYFEGRLYHALRPHDEHVVCAAWEAQEIAGLDSDAADSGLHFTQPWESYMGTPGDPVKFRLPDNLTSVLFIAYDRQTIGGTTKKAVQSQDASYVQTQGTPQAYYAWDQYDAVLYPRPSVGFSNETEGEGIVLFEDGDSEDVSTGDVALRTGSFETDEGAAFDILDATDNLFMVYRARPADMTTGSDEPDFPAFLRRYVIFGVIGRAYSANTDGRIKSLGGLWDSRYQLGVNIVKRYMRNRRQDRDYRLSAASSRVRSRAPRLPSTYPAV